MNKVLDRIFSVKKNTGVERNKKEILTKRYLQIFGSRNQLSENNERTLIIIPGYSVDNPPKIGHHLYYINALKYDQESNPFGYKRIYLFDIYSRKDGRCNFKHSIPELADELFASISTDRDSWEFQKNGEVDIIGASMGGLIARKFIQDKMIGNNLLPTSKWGMLRIRNVLLIATPNKGCKIVDKLQSPILQFLLRLLYGKENFSKSEQFLQISAGGQPVFGRFLGLFSKKKSAKNKFIEKLNSVSLTPGAIRWMTIRGTKKQWFSRSIYRKESPNDGVVEAADVVLPGAENICDKDLDSNTLWNHRDLYVSEDVSSLMFGLLVLELDLATYLLISEDYNDEVSLWSHSHFDEPTKPLDVFLKKPVTLVEK